MDKRKEQVGVRVLPEVKQILISEAKKEARSLSYVAGRILTEWAMSKK